MAVSAMTRWRADRERHDFRRGGRRLPERRDPDDPINVTAGNHVVFLGLTTTDGHDLVIGFTATRPAARTF